MAIFQRAGTVLPCLAINFKVRSVQGLSGWAMLTCIGQPSREKHLRSAVSGQFSVYLRFGGHVDQEDFSGAGANQTTFLAKSDGLSWNGRNSAVAHRSTNSSVWPSPSLVPSSQRAKCRLPPWPSWRDSRTRMQSPVSPRVASPLLQAHARTRNRPAVAAGGFSGAGAGRRRRPSSRVSRLQTEMLTNSTRLGRTR